MHTYTIMISPIFLKVLSYSFFHMSIRLLNVFNYMIKLMFSNK